MGSTFVLLEKIDLQNFLPQSSRRISLRLR